MARGGAGKIHNSRPDPIFFAGFAYWDRRTIIRKARDEAIEVILCN